VGTVRRRITSIARTAFDTVRAVVKNDLQAIAGVFTLIGDLIHGRWSKLWDDVVNIVSHQLQAIWALARGAASIAGGLLVAAGRALIQGFVHGIESMFDSVKHSLGNLTSKLTSWKGPPATDLMLLFSSGQLVIKGFQMGMESEYPAVKKSLKAFTEAIAADAYRGAAAAIQRVQEAFSGSTGSRVKTHSSAPTQYRDANGNPLADWWVQQQIDASLQANPDASTGAYQGPPMGDQYGRTGGDIHTTVMLPDGSVLGKTVQKWAAQDVRRGGAGVPG
jgi:phage-related protein